MIGRKIVATATNGGARISTARSGTANDRFFGTISPNTTCRNDTNARVTPNAMPPMTSSGQWVSSSGISSR